MNCWAAARIRPRADDGLSPGPVFANLVLADEINRAAPKTQSALLEAMAERHVTVGGKTYPLEEPFLVAATQNPIEQEGTYPLPEAQLDRFMMEIRIGYPSPAQEEEIVHADDLRRCRSCRRRRWTREEFLQLRDLVLAVPVANNVAADAVRLCGGEPAGRPPRQLPWQRLRGLGRRPARLAEPGAGGQGPGLAGRPHGPRAEDIQAVALPILRHRIIVNHRAVGDSITSADIIAATAEEATP